jgi:hypothetical protein
MRNNQWKFNASGKLPIRNPWNIPQIGDEEPKDHTLSPVGLGNTRIFTDYAQNSPPTFLPSI